MQQLFYKKTTTQFFVVKRIHHNPHRQYATGSELTKF